MASGDLLPIVADPLGNPTNKKITLGNFYSNVAVAVTFSNTVSLSAPVTSTSNIVANNLFVSYSTTPSTSGDIVSRGKIWWDTNYIYVSVGTNTIKRVPLSSF